MNVLRLTRWLLPGATRMCRVNVLKTTSLIALAVYLAFLCTESSFAAESQCRGDCNMNGAVSMDELVLLVSIATERAELSRCPILSEPPAIDYLVGAVDRAIGGCPVTPAPTETPFPMRMITYRLSEESTLIHPAHAQTASEPVPEPLSGTFSVITLLPDPNATFTFQITELEFVSMSGSHIISSSGGLYGITFLHQPTAFMSTRTQIDSVPVRLQGNGPYTLAELPNFNGLQICGPGTCESIRRQDNEGYIVTIFASPE